MIQIALYQPEIPPNTGNIIRLAANTGALLHLIGPLGFELDNARLRRAGLDYHEFATVRRHPDWEQFLSAVPGTRLYAFSTRGQLPYTTARFETGDILLFGPETRGLPTRILSAIGTDRTLRIPMIPGSRSLNLSNAVAVAVFEAWRQTGFPGS